MLFDFLKYLQPTHYFQRFSKNESSVFPKVEHIPESILNQLIGDTGYKSTNAQDYDLSWQAVQKGYIGNVPTYKSFEKVDLQDNYHFIRKYFNKAWVFYVLLLRVFSFHNPFKEAHAYFKTRNVNRILVGKNPIVYKDWNAFDSLLIKANPEVSVIIPTLNRYSYLKDVLHDLEKQEYTNFEVLIVDQSQPFQSKFYDEFDLDIKAVYQEEKALWLARNEAIKSTESDYILLFDDDSRVNTDWIINHLKCLDFFNSYISSGVSISKFGAKVPDNYSYFRVSDQLDTGNVLIHKKVFRDIGLFDRQFEKQRMGDGEFGLRAYLAGYLNVSNPFAERLHLKVGTGGLREMGSWDGFRPSNYFAPRPIPSVLYFFRRYFGNKAAKLAMLRTIPLSVFPYQFKKNKPLLIFGVLLTILILPIVFYQVFKSWRLASKKIKEGPLIENL